MLCVLFLAARMRALEVTEGLGAPQVWAQTGMQFATWAIAVQLFMSILGSVFNLGVKLDENGDVVAKEGGNKWFMGLVTFIRFGSMAAMYGGAGVVQEK